MMARARTTLFRRPGRGGCHLPSGRSMSGPLRGRSGLPALACCYGSKGAALACPGCCYGSRGLPAPNRPVPPTEMGRVSPALGPFHVRPATGPLRGRPACRPLPVAKGAALACPEPLLREPCLLCPRPASRPLQLACPRPAPGPLRLACLPPVATEAGLARPRPPRKPEACPPPTCRYGTCEPPRTCEPPACPPRTTARRPGVRHGRLPCPCEPTPLGAGQS